MSKYTLVGVDGNAFAIMGYTAKAMKRTGFARAEIDKMYAEATSGNYYNLIAVCDEYINKCNEALDADEDDENEECDY